MMKSGGNFKWGVLTIICMAVFIMVIDTTIMNVSITALVQDLNTTVPIIQAIIAIYALVMASFMLIGGKLQDVLGRKKAFLIGTGIYGIGTFTASMSWNATILLIGWAILEGLGAILMMPATTTFLTSTYSGRDLAFAFGMWGGIGAAGAAFGPILGGYLTTFYSWRWAFRIELVVVILILVLSYLLTESRPTLKWRDLDVVGTLLSFAGLFAIVMGILLMRNYELWQYISTLIGGGLLIMGVFFLWQKRRKTTGRIPLVDISIFRNRSFVLGNTIGVVQNIAFAGFLFIIPVFYQQVTGISAFETGLLLLPMSIAVFIFSIGGARLSAFISPKHLLIAGLLLGMAGSFMLRGIFGLGTGTTDFIPGSVVLGVGLGIVLSQVTNLTLSSVPDEHATDAAGVLNTLRQLGTSLGTAIIGVILIIFIYAGIVDEVEQQAAVAGIPAGQLATGLQGWVDKMQTGSPEIAVPDTVLAQLADIADTAIGAGMLHCFDAITLFFGIALIASLFLPRKTPPPEHDKKV
ncbi:MFS transporter [Methanogenium sp. S4BF]|uniref:MFS transporter n=1 Tax=Methanogenium sp. S4BF TaxID=1789226 RepID=UPI00241764B7|nr:MFS transporter [Methanogenium sp. S4BF]WFN34240.1 MFS transporter [Methanogenium sp. S4BF]